jgi:prophage antirepressor-like protein
VRVLCVDGKPVCVAAELCRALGLDLSSKGRLNVTEALKRIDAGLRRRMSLEDARHPKAL